MKIRSLSISGLFGEYNYSMALNDRLTFIHSPNGYGKSTIMHLIYSLFDGEAEYVKETPFDTLRFELSDGSTILADNTCTSLVTKIIRDGNAEPFSMSQLNDLIDALYISSDRLTLRFNNGIFMDTMEAIELDLHRRFSTDEQDVSVKSDMLSSLVNSIFVNKKMEISEQGSMTVRMKNGTSIPIDRLSAGEKHVLIMFYGMLFLPKKGSIVIVDEPEISLHVTWQQRLGDIFEELSEYMDQQLIIATHSPMVIHDKWDLAMELRRSDARIHHSRRYLQPDIDEPQPFQRHHSSHRRQYRQKTLRQVHRPG